MSEAIIRVLDFESAGNSPEEFGLCELAYTDVVARGFDLAGEPCDWEVVDGKARLCNPGCHIPPETAAVHHIMDEDVADLPNWKPLLASLVKASVGVGVMAFAAHGASFEKLWLHPDWYGNAPPLEVLDTYKCALRLWKDAPLHSNMGLRYHRMPVGMDRQKALPAHRAGPDSYVTAFHVRDMLNEGCPLGQMIEWSNQPALTLRCYMRDYRNGGKGTPWEEVDSGLLRWIRDKDISEDMVFTVEHHLALREEAERLEREKDDLDRQLAANGLAPTEPIHFAAPPDHAEHPPTLAPDPSQGDLL